MFRCSRLDPLLDLVLTAALKESTEVLVMTVSKCRVNFCQNETVRYGVGWSFTKITTSASLTQAHTHNHRHQNIHRHALYTYALTHSHTQTEICLFMHDHEYNLCLRRNHINTRLALKCQPVSDKVHKDPIYLWIWHLSCLSALKLFLLSKCVFRRRRRRWRKDRDEDADWQTDWKGVWANDQRDQPVTPWGLGILTPTWSKTSLSMSLLVLAHGCDQRVALADKNITKCGQNTNLHLVLMSELMVEVYLLSHTLVFIFPFSLSLPFFLS